MKTKFVKFLKDNNLSLEYIKAVNYQGKTVQEALENTNPTYYIAALDWNNTNGVRVNWAQINELWWAMLNEK